MEYVAVVLVLLVIWVLFRSYIAPIRSLESIDYNLIDREKYCLIDVRDYIASHQMPFRDACNIPLSYLSREVKKKLECEKDIVLICDDFRGAKMAARILNKQRVKKIYYIQAV